MAVLNKSSIFNSPDIALYIFKYSFIFFLAVYAMLKIFVRYSSFIKFEQQAIALLNYLIYFYCVFYG